MNGFVYVLALFTADVALPVDLGRYDTAVECDLQARSVKVHHRGAQLRCVRVETGTHQRAAVAAAERSHDSPRGPEMTAVLP